MSNAPNDPNVPNGEKAPNEPNLPLEDVLNKIILHSKPKSDGKSKSNGKSTITKAHHTGPSLRTTIPRSISEMLGLDAGDTLSWEIEKRGDRYYIIVRRLE